MANSDAKMALCAGLGKFMESADLSDYTLVCGTSKWNVHRIVLALHSSVLGKACNSDFKEAKQAQYDLSQHEVTQVNALVKYLYTFDYSTEAEIDHSAQMSFHVNMCIIADKYDIQQLKTLAIQRFKGIVENTKSFAELAHPLDLAYEAPAATKDLRESMVKMINAKKRMFTAVPTAAEMFVDAMKGRPELAVDLVMAGSSIALPKYTCPSCQGIFHAAMPTDRYNGALQCPICDVNQFHSAYTRLFA